MRKLLSVPILLSLFLRNECWVLSDPSLRVSDDRQVVLFRSLIWWITVIDSQMLHSCHKTSMGIVNFPFHMLWIQYAKILFRIFASIFTRILSCNFPAASSSGFGNRLTLVSQAELGSSPSSLLFWKSLCRTVLFFPELFGRIYQWASLDLEFSLWEIVQL